MAILTTGSRTRAQSRSGDDVYRNRRPRGNNVAAYLFLGPQLLGLVVFMVGPLLFALVLAFYHWDGFGTRSFAGLSNFADVLSSPRIRQSAVNTVWFTVLQVPGLMLTAFFFAVLSRVHAIDAESQVEHPQGPARKVDQDRGV